MKKAALLKKVLNVGGTKPRLVCLLISAAALMCSIFRFAPLPFDASWIAIILCGVPIVCEAAIALVTEFDIKADLLVSIALIAAVCIGEHFAAGEVAFIMQVGSLLEALTVAKARAGIERLVKLTPRTARVLTPDGEEVIPAEQVTEGAMLRVLPGEIIPVDGVITAGQTSIDQAVMTGEAMPVDKSAGDEVLSGTVNQFGAFEMRASRVGEDSSIRRMIRLVQTADAGKAKIVGLADRWATWIVAAALAAAAVTWLVSGQLIRAVTILVVFCPCSLVLATPTAIMAAIGNAAKHGFLVKEGDALERLAMISRVCFDKTGTLTLGTPGVAEVRSLSGAYSRDEVYRLAAMAEKSSEHPLGRALVRCYRQESGRDAASPADFRMIPGQGVFAVADGREILAGNLRLMADHGVDAAQLGAAGADLQERGCSVIYICIDGTAAGLIAMSDTLREGMAETMEQIFDTGARPVLLTGDHRRAAAAIADRLGIDKVIADCLPEDKLHYIEESQAFGHKVCMVGDGVNDAPALKKACVGIAMGGVGSDIAVDAADIVLADDRLGELPHLLRLSRRMLTTIKRNLAFSMLLNLAAILLAMTGRLDPVAGALVHNCGSVLVIISSALLLVWKKPSAELRAGRSKPIRRPTELFRREAPLRDRG